MTSRINAPYSAESPNKYSGLMNGESCVTNLTSRPLQGNNTHTKKSNERPSIVTKENPENDNPLNYKSVKHRPGNSAFSSMSNKCKKTNSE